MIETDKVVMELPAPADGVHRQVIKARWQHRRLQVKSSQCLDTEARDRSCVASGRRAQLPLHAGAPHRRQRLHPQQARPPCQRLPRSRRENNVNTGSIAGTGRGRPRDLKEDVVGTMIGWCSGSAPASCRLLPHPGSQAGSQRHSPWSTPAIGRTHRAARTDVAPARSASPSDWCNRNPPPRSSPRSTK